MVVAVINVEIFLMQQFLLKLTLLNLSHTPFPPKWQPCQRLWLFFRKAIFQRQHSSGEIIRDSFL